MYDPAVLRFALISGLFGFAAFCISSGVLVWYRRQRSARERPGMGTVLRRTGRYLVFGGALCVGIAVAVREVDYVKGTITSEGLYAIRAPDGDYRVTFLADEDSVAADDILACFESPQAEAEVQELELKSRRLGKQRDALQLEPLALDSELVRHHQNAIAAVNQLRAAVGQLLPEHESVVRQTTMERLSRREKNARLAVDLSASEGQLVQARAHRTYLARELERALRLSGRNAVAQSEVDAWRKQLEDADTSIANLERQIEGLTKERQQLEQSLAEIATLANHQLETLGSELERSRSECSSANSQSSQLSAKLQLDGERAQSRRRQELEQLDLQIQECHAQLAGVSKTLTVRAPYDGAVVYRDPSPRSAEQLQAILVVARQPGFRLNAMLPDRQLSALADAGQVTMELLHPTVERFFSGTLLRARPVLQKPGYVIAQLACRPPEQTIRELLEGARIEARLQWRPPLLALPLVRIAAVLSTVGLAIWLLGLVVGWLAAMMGRPVASNSRPQGNGQPAPALGVGSTPGPLETGSVSALHELLGERLREVVLRDEVDTDLLASIEWALDRHHVRAVRQMRAGFHWDAALARRVAQLRAQWEGDHGPSHSVSDGNGHRYSRDRERILRVLRAIDAEPFGVWSGSCDSEI